MEVNIACMILRTIVGVFSLACGISSAVIFYPDQQPVYIQTGSLLELRCQGGNAGIMITSLLRISCSIEGSPLQGILYLEEPLMFLDKGELVMSIILIRALIYVEKSCKMSLHIATPPLMRHE